MKQAAKATERIHQEINPDTVADLVDNVQEQMADTQEISDALGQPMGDMLELDEDEMDAELAGLMGEDEATAAKTATTAKATTTTTKVETKTATTAKATTTTTKV